MDIEEAILSDALVGTDSGHLGESIGENQYEIVRTRFEFWNALSEESGSSDEEEDSGGVNLDSDGDFKIARRPKCRDWLLMDHTMATTLVDVGLQVWHGALLLGDYILCHPSDLKGKVVLELGCGIGLTSICASMTGAEITFATDSEDEALKMTQRNIRLNSRLLPGEGKTVDTKVVDWRTPFSKSIEQWPKADRDHVEKLEVILAADVIYDADLNTALFSIIEQICAISSISKTVLVSLEKRYNFALSEMAEACPAYAHFLCWVDDLKTKGWKCEKIDTGEIPVCFNYQRNSGMELWRLQSSIA